MSDKLPFFQFYPSAWIADTRHLSLAAKGAWTDILCALWGSSNRGSRSLSMEGWARTIGSSIEQAKVVIDELVSTQVCDCVTNSNGYVTLISRRQTREEKERSQTRERVRRHRGKRGNAEETRYGNAPVTPDMLDLRGYKLHPPNPPLGGEGVNSAQTGNGNGIKPPGFDDFWAIYPRKVAKPRAEAKWRKIKPDSILIAKILNSVRRYTKTQAWQKDDGQFVPYADKWLGDRRWDDEIPIEQSELEAQKKQQFAQAKVAMRQTWNKAGLCGECGSKINQENGKKWCAKNYIHRL